MIIEPVVTSWASLEGRVIDNTVSGMYDSANNAGITNNLDGLCKRNESELVYWGL
jgi:hypothetical protein